MKCTDVRKHLVALADGQLAGRKLAAVQDHLQICVECRGLLEALKSDADLLRLEAQPVLPDALSTRIMSRIRTDGDLGRDRFWGHDPLRSTEPGSCPPSRIGSWPGLIRHWDFGLRVSLSQRLPAAAVLFILAVGLWLGATLGQTLFRQSWESRQRAIVAECGLPLDDFANQLFGGYR